MERCADCELLLEKMLNRVPGKYLIIRTDILIRKQTFILAAQAQGCNWQTLERRDKTKRGLSRKWRKMNSKMFWELVSSENLL